MRLGLGYVLEEMPDETTIGVSTCPAKLSDPEQGRRERGEGVLPDDSALLPASWLIDLY